MVLKLQFTETRTLGSGIRHHLGRETHSLPAKVEQGGTVYWNDAVLGPPPTQADITQWEAAYIASIDTPESKLDRLSRSPAVQRADLAAIVRASRHYLTLPIDQKNKIQQLIDDGAQIILDAING